MQTTGPTIPNVLCAYYFQNSALVSKSFWPFSKQPVDVYRCPN